MELINYKKTAINNIVHKARTEAIQRVEKFYEEK